MTRERIEVLGLGNSLVDILAPAEDDFLRAEAIQKGGMTLIDEARAEALYAHMSATTIVSGGSAANTVVGVRSLGVKAAYIGKVKDDELGRAFIHDIRATGVGFSVKPAAEGPATGRCYIFVTPDGERSMNTYLGASQLLSPPDLDENLVREARIVYLEGYLWDRQAAKETFQKAARIAHAAGARVALTLSDAFCVDRFRAEFLDLIRSGLVDTVFANTEEVHSLYQTADFKTALEALRAEGALGVVTRSENGSIVVDGQETFEVPAFPIDRLTDTTGAGDLFAAGFLAGMARDAGHVTSARLGALAAAEVIQHLGARPQVRLADLAAENGLAV
ncbi:MAG TPA: adenosine kinase [Roseiarcus sp.]|nr:adenosine kinase [Roseiarcus sp.]